ncbi:hypothetical protein FIBSPDRAFT_929948 [Athelia psychrophila]|uniref:AB hydrolase-1 domain-containing protein n=1 Tax=Athelia psychrophila TaxID=1759441 RepID=A0A166MZI2_9AGAM|nr:hypothetical protein FIBSPDRAFT_929948 [Fibularhizoctonia sp. CBS 109695]
MSVPTTTCSTIGVDGVEVFYPSAGDPAAPVVLLLHGFPTSSHQYRRLRTPADSEERNRNILCHVTCGHTARLGEPAKLIRCSAAASRFTPVLPASDILLAHWRQITWNTLEPPTGTCNNTMPLTVELG